jgi:hypothetical protein
LAVIALFCAANLFVPLALGEMYPFSNAPMFYNAPQCYCDYKVQTPDGGVIEKEALTPLGLQRNYWGNPPDRGMGIQAPPTVDCFGEVACKEDVCAQVCRWLREHPEVPYLDVTQQVIGPVDALRIGPVESHTWRVENPGR